MSDTRYSERIASIAAQLANYIDDSNHMAEEERVSNELLSEHIRYAASDRAIDAAAKGLNAKHAAQNPKLEQSPGRAD